MTTPTPTIIDLKTGFLRAQTSLLSQPLRAPSSLPETEDALRQKSIDDALLKLNAQLKRQNKLAYGPQATRHVAEQIDRLYWNAGERSVLGSGGEGEEWEVRGCDLRKEEIIEQLPAAWSEEAESVAPEKAARYKELQARLAELNERRKEARGRVERYRALKGLLVPFEEGADVQANLVTKGGEVEKELERMKLLMVRVQRGVQGLEQRDVDAEEMDLDVDGDEQEKVLAVLGGE